VMANNSNFISYPNAVPKAKALMDKSITDDPTIYPPPTVEAKLFTFAIIPPAVNDQYTRIWTDLKTGK
ncbi:MAG: spermidine/putrescine ABC transporter substrate-binding protein PotF, partial [Pseudoxanthomonas sp.]